MTPVPQPRAAMLLAAGLGQRMRPLTANTAKPLLPLGGRALMDHALDRLAAAGVTRVVVNAHWRAEQVAGHLAATARPGLELILRREEALLDTGGAVRACLPDLGPEPFYVVNGDAFWVDGPSTPALTRLARAWNPSRADAVLLVHRTFQVAGDTGQGDFAVDKWGLVRRRAEREVVPYIYAGVQIVSDALFADAPADPFSMNRLWDRAIAAERLHAVVHDGLWFHLSTPPDLAEAENRLAARALGESR